MFYTSHRAAMRNLTHIVMLALSFATIFVIILGSLLRTGG